MISLAIDSSKHRVYALVEGMVSLGAGKAAPVAQRLVAWSTMPNPGKELVAASGYPIDELTGAALVAGKSALQSGELSHVLFAPDGLVVDPANHDVVIEAQLGVEPANERPGPTMLQRVSSEGASSGHLGERWVASEEDAPGEEHADGVFTTSKGFGVDLQRGLGDISRLLNVTSNLSAATVSSIAPDGSGGLDFDQAPTSDLLETVAGLQSGGSQVLSNVSALTPSVSGSPIVGLSDGHIYAARFGEGGQVRNTPDPQSEAKYWEGISHLFFWTQEVGETEQANMGIRLFEEDGNILTTIGGGPEGQACDLRNAQIAVVAGAEDSVFVLAQGQNGLQEDEVIEFAKGGSGVCPQVSGTIKVEGAEATAKGGEPVPSVTVHAGVPVKFDASSISRAGESPFEFDWNFTGATEGGPKNDGYTQIAKIEGPAYKWPTPLAEHIYEPGEYEASVRLTGDYGVNIFPVKLKVLDSKPPRAEFKVPASVTAGQAVTLDAKASTPTGGSRISEYHWEITEGGKITKVSREGPLLSHTFIGAGTDRVTLTVTDEVPHTSEPYSQEVIVQSAPGGCQQECGGGCQQNCLCQQNCVPLKLVIEKQPAFQFASALVNGKEVALGVTCPAEDVSCQGTVELRTAEAVAASVARKRKRGKKHARKAPLALGRASFNLFGGKSETVRIGLTSKGMALLRKAHSLRVLATITTVIGGETTMSTETLTLHAPKTSKKGKRGHKGRGHR
jgi:PKD repeat protein